MEENDNGKRIKMIEKGMEDQKSRKILAHKRNLSQLTSLRKQIEQLMKDDVNAASVKNNIRVYFSGLQRDFLRNSCLQKLMDLIEHKMMESIFGAA